MYNAEQKNSFMNTITNDNSYKSYQRVFKTIESMEQKFGKDICDMNVEELLIVMDIKTGTRDNNTIQFMSLLRSYVDWCIQNGKSSTSENNFEKIDASEIDKRKIFQEKYIKNPEEFEEMISVVFKKDAFYREDIEIPKELCVRLCYEGMEDEEIVNLKKTDVDFNNNILKSPLYPDIEYLVSDRIMELCRYCIEQTEVSYNSKNGKERKERLCDNEYVLRQRIGTLRGNPENRPINSVLIIRRVKEFCNAYYEAVDHYKNVTASKLRESRLFYQILMSNDEDKFINESVKCDILLRDESVNNRQMYERLRQIKTSYAKWKEAFY